MHGVNLHAEFLTILVKQVDERVEVYGALVDVYQHDHCKYIFHYVLRNVDDVDLLLIERVRNLGDDTGTVLACYCDYCAHSDSSIFAYMLIYHKQMNNGKLRIRRSQLFSGFHHSIDNAVGNQKPLFGEIPP